MSEEKRTSRQPSLPFQDHNGGNYTQINVLFPSSQVELPAAEKFNAFPELAQKAILEAFQKEQVERHKWLSNQQSNEHALNMQTGRYHYQWRTVGTIMGAIVIITAIGIGGWLVKSGASAVGISLILLAVLSMVGSAMHGQRSNPKESIGALRQNEPAQLPPQ